MVTTVEQPGVGGLSEVLAALRDWQTEAAPFQLHPGDLGWLWRRGAEATVAATRVWRRDGSIVAVGELDGDALVRLGIAPDVQHDEDLARRLAADLSDPDAGVLGAGEVAVEAPPGALVRDVMADGGWVPGESWTPLRRGLADPVEDPGVPVEVIGPAQVRDRTAVQRAASTASTFTDEAWRTMAAGPAYADARCLVARDASGAAVAAVTVWSAGAGRPGLLEPMGVHADHRRRGHGRAVTVAAAATLRELGCSSAVVCTPSANVPGVATYESAGFVRLPERLDLRRPRTSVR